MYDIVVRPAADQGPNDYSPVPNNAHYLNVDDDPNDGDATRLQPTANGNAEQFLIDVSPIPEGAQIVSVRLRWAARPGNTAALSSRIALRIFDALYYGPTHNQAQGGGYVVWEDPFPVFPPDGGPWNKSRLSVTVLRHEILSGGDQVSKAALSSCVLVATLIETLARPKGSGQSLAPGGTGGSLADTGGGQSLAPKGGGASLAPSAAGASRAPQGSGASLAASASGVALAPRAATIRSPSGLIVTVQSLAPLGTAVSLGQQVSGNSLEPQAGGE